MAFHEVRFPSNISYGSRGGPGLKTNIIETDSGAEQRISRWASARHMFNARYGIKTYEDLSEVKRFYLARRGATHGFRYKDWTDYKSTANSLKTDVTSATDQLIGLGDGTTTQFQLLKKYTSGSQTYVRTIEKPVAGSVKVAIDGVVQNSGWSINTTTGMITFSVAPSLNAEVTAGYEFDVPVRFGKEVDDLLSISVDDFSSGSIGDIPIVEIINELPIPDEFPYGGAALIQFSSDVTINLSSGRMLSAVPSTTGLSMLLPNNSSLPKGTPYWVIANASSNAFDLKKHDGTTIRTMGAGDIVTVSLGVDGSNNPVWWIA